MLVSIVIPCYNSEKSIREVVELTMREFEALDGYECEFVLVNDCSSDSTFEQIRALGAEYPNVHGLNLMRNFGQHNALMCALNYTQGEYILGMDDDLQTHPSQIPVLIREMEKGYDMVYGVYRHHKNSPLKNLTSWINKVTSRALLGRPKDVQSSNFWIITEKVREEVIVYRNYNPYVDGLFYRATHNIGNVEIEHHKREFGSSGYTLKKLMKLWLAYIGFSVLPLRIATFVGSAFSVIGFIAGLVVLIQKLTDPTMTIGWASLMCVQFLFFGIVLLVLGIIGEYIGEIVLSINKTPQYIVRDKVNL